MSEPDGLAFFGTYLEVVPNSRLVWTDEEGGENGPITTVTFEEQHGRTLLVLRELHASKEALDEAGTGAAEATVEAFAQLDVRMQDVTPLPSCCWRRRSRVDPSKSDVPAALFDSEGQIVCSADVAHGRAATADRRAPWAADLTASLPTLLFSDGWQATASHNAADAIGGRRLTGWSWRPD